MYRIFLWISVLVLLITACTPGNPTQLASPGTTEQPVETASPTTDDKTATSEPLPSPTLGASPTQVPQISETTPTTETPLVSPTPPPIEQTPTLINPDETGAIIIDHNSVDLFEQIPIEYLEAARDLKAAWFDASVGKNIDEALDCLAATSWSSSPAYCRRDYTGETFNFETFNQQDLSAGRVPDRILFEPNSSLYDRSKWAFQLASGLWDEMIRDFIQNGDELTNQFDVVSLKFNYSHVSEMGTIAGERDADGTYHGGFLDPDPGNPERWDISDLQSFQAEHPETILFYWTTSLARAIGTQSAVDFNQAMRQYALENGLMLFDLADIESHDPDGNACFDARDGVCYCNTNQCEDYTGQNPPQSCDWDDGLEIPAICQDYTTETEGGHLGSVSAGKIRIAKAFWVLMARIAGWDGKTP